MTIFPPLEDQRDELSHREMGLHGPREMAESHIDTISELSRRGIKCAKRNISGYGLVDQLEADTLYKEIEDTSIDNKVASSSVNRPWRFAIVVVTTTALVVSAVMARSVTELSVFIRGNPSLLLTKREAQRITDGIRKKPHQSDFTLRLRGSRMELLDEALDRYTLCPTIRAVQIDWTGVDDPFPDQLLMHHSSKVETLGSSSTDAVLLLDEGLWITCEEIERAFNEWRRDRTRVVGFIPLHKPDGGYSFVTDEAAFVHQAYLASAPQQLSSSCRRLTLSAWASTVTHKSPLAVSVQLGGSQRAESSTHQETCQSAVMILASLATMPTTLVAVTGRPTN